MRNLFFLVAVFLAVALTGLARQPETIEELKTRAESAKIEDRAVLYTEIAQREVDAADKLFTDGKAEEGQAAVQDVVTYSEKASGVAMQTGKKLKQTEIGVRKMAARLRDIKRTLAFEDQAPVQTAVDRLEQLRTDLLSRMFGTKKGEQQ